MLLALLFVVAVDVLVIMGFLFFFAFATFVVLSLVHQSTSPDLALNSADRLLEKVAIKRKKTDFVHHRLVIV